MSGKSANALVLLLVYCNRFNVLCFASELRSFPKASAKLQPKIPVCKFFERFNVYLTLQAPKSPNFPRRQMFFARVHINTLKYAQKIAAQSKKNPLLVEKMLPPAGKMLTAEKKEPRLPKKECSRRRKETAPAEKRKLASRHLRQTCSAKRRESTQRQTALGRHCGLKHPKTNRARTALRAQGDLDSTRRAGWR